MHRGTAAALMLMGFTKQDSAHSGYASEASYCVPMRRDAPVAIPKVVSVELGAVSQRLHRLREPMP
jgi:hypothetical protein